MANGFHIDGDGNLWIGSTSTNFDNNAAFYVKTDGEMKATSGEIGGLDIESNRIKSSSYSNTNSEGFQIHSDGTARFYGSLTANSLSAAGANISGNITSNDGSIGGITIDSSGIEAGYTQGNAGFRIGSDGNAEFNDVTVRGDLDGVNFNNAFTGKIATANTGTRVEIEGGTSGLIQFLYKDGNTATQQTGTISSDSSGLVISSDLSEYLTLSGATGIKSFGKWYYWDGSGYSNSNNTNHVLKISSVGPVWGSVPATAGVTSVTAVGGNVIATGNANTGSVIITDNHEDHSNLANSNHNHNATNQNNLLGLDDSHNHGSTNAAGALTGINAANVLVNSTQNNNAGVYHSHTTGNVTSVQVQGNMLSQGNSSSAILIYDNHGNDHHSSSDHTGNNNNNLATVGYVNSRGFTSNNGNSNLGTHGNGSHNDLGFGTGNSNINSTDVNSIVDNNHKVVSGYSHASSVHNNGNGNGNMNAANHYNSNISINTHYHPNTIIHDTRLLNINANTVPGVNFINRLNPVQTNFIGNVETKLTDKENISGFITDHLQATAFTLTAQDVEQALIDDGHSGDYAIYLDNVDYYTEEHSEDLPEGETVKGYSQEHMIPVLVQAIKDLSATIDTLEARITTLEG
jgi:hypothetical protein